MADQDGHIENEDSDTNNNNNTNRNQNPPQSNANNQQNSYQIDKLDPFFMQPSNNLD